MTSEYTESYSRTHQHVTEHHWKNALSSQNANNASGIVHTLSGAMHVIWRDARELGEGTEWVNKHPICFLMGIQISFLTGGDSVPAMEKYEEAVRICTAQVSRHQEDSDDSASTQHP